MISKTGYCFLWLHSMLYVLCLWPPCIMTGLGACSTAANRTGSIRSERWLCNSSVMPAGGAERVDRFNVNKNHNAIRQKNRNVSAWQFIHFIMTVHQYATVYRFTLFNVNILLYSLFELLHYFVSCVFFSHLFRWFSFSTCCIVGSRTRNCFTTIGVYLTNKELD